MEHCRNWEILLLMLLHRMAMHYFDTHIAIALVTLLYFTVRPCRRMQAQPRGHSGGCNKPYTADAHCFASAEHDSEFIDDIMTVFTSRFQIIQKFYTCHKNRMMTDHDRIDDIKRRHVARLGAAILAAVICI